MKKSLRRHTLLLQFTLIAALVALVAAPGLTLAHGEAIQVDPLQAKPGEAVTITGTGWEAGSMVPVTLEGIRGIASLGTAEVDEKGGFTLKVTLPEDLQAGSYSLVARLGDDTVAVDFTVLAVTIQQSEPVEMSSGAAEGEVVFQRNAVETIAVAIIVAALIGAGAFLVLMGTERRPRLQQ